MGLRSDRAGNGMLGAGLSAGVYRSELSLDIKQSSDSAVTTSWGSPYQSCMVLVKNDTCLYCVLRDGTQKVFVSSSVVASVVTAAPEPPFSYGAYAA